MTTRPGWEPFLYDHIGILVADLEEARERFVTVLGLRFTPTISGNPHGGWEEPDVAGPPPEMCFCYSYDGPPYYELIQATGEGMYSAAHLGFHHIGFRVPDVAATLEDFAAHDLHAQVRRREPADDHRIYTAFTRPDELLGIRCELSWSGRPHILARLAAEKPG